MNDLLEMANPAPFDAGSDRRTFRIGTSDAHLSLLWLQLRQHAEQFAPGIDFHAAPLLRPNIPGQLISADIDVAIDLPLEQPNNMIRSEALFDSHFACVMRPDHPLATEGIPLDAFVAADHLLVSLAGDAVGFVDEIGP